MSIDSILIIATIVAITIGLVAYNIVKFIKMPAEERKQLLVNWVMGAIVAAQNHFTESGHGAEKLAEVEEYFKTKAPMVYKIVLKFTKTTDLRDVIETALNIIKETKF